MVNNQYMTEADIRRFDSFVAGAGFNISSLSEAIGMTRATLTNKRLGKTDFSRSDMEKISKVIGARPEAIFFGE